MTKKYIILLIVVALLIAGYWIYKTNKPAPTPTRPISGDPKNATYLIEGQNVTLKNGESEVPIAPDSASKVTTDYFGNEVTGDFNNDNINDTTFILTQSTGGTGIFYYVVALLSSPKGFIGTNAIFLGDRIAPQSTEFKNGEIIVNYADRKPNDPMSADPSVAVLKYVTVTGNSLSEVTK